MSLDSVELLRRLCVRLRSLSAHGQTNRMPLADVTANHPMVSNFLPHFTFQVRLYPQPMEWVRSLGLDPWQWQRRQVEPCEVCECPSQVLKGS